MDIERKGHLPHVSNTAHVPRANVLVKCSRIIEHIPIRHHTPQRPSTQGFQGSSKEAGEQASGTHRREGRVHYMAAVHGYGGGWYGSRAWCEIVCVHGHGRVCVCECVDAGRQPSTTEASLPRCTCCTLGCTTAVWTSMVQDRGWASHGRWISRGRGTYHMSVTLLTSHEPMSWLNAAAS